MNENTEDDKIKERKAMNKLPAVINLVYFEKP